MQFRILNVIATSDLLTALECTKFDFGRGSAPDGPRWGSLQRSPDSLAGLRGLLLSGGKGKGRGKEGRGGSRRGRGGTGNGGNRREGVAMSGKKEGRGEE